MDLGRTVLVTVALSGGLAALAGVCEVAGVQGQLKHGLSPGYGYTAIIVAWVGRLNPWGIMRSACSWAASWSAARCCRSP
jgi:ABC-type uncharacterized transport system permease subunit